MATIKIEDVLAGKLINNGDVIQFKNYYSIHYNGNNGNCKLCTLDSVSGVIHSNFQEFKEFIKCTRKLMFNVNLIHKNLVDKLAKEFEVVYINEVPVGYGTGMQYHCCFLTNYNYNDKAHYKARITREGVKGLKRTDDSLINTIKQLSIEQVEKLKSYKYPANAKKYLNKIIK